MLSQSAGRLGLDTTGAGLRSSVLVADRSPRPKVVDDWAGLGYAAVMNKPLLSSLLHRASLGRSVGALTVLLVLLVLAGCSGISIGIGLPIGGFGGVGVSVGSDGRVSGNVGAGRGGVSAGVGGSAQLPKSSEPAASAPPQ